MSKNKKIIGVILVLAAIFILAIHFSKKAPVITPTPVKNPINVSVQAVTDSEKLTQTIEYPAITTGDQEVTLTARTSGTVTQLNFDLGSRVGQGTQLATIDTIGNFSKIGDKDLKSSDTEILDLAVDQAEQAVKLAKANYDANKTDANKKAINIAEIQLDSARVARKAALDTRFVVSPIAGVITDRTVSLGDSVSVGQTIAKISKTALKVVDFFVNQEDLPNIKIGTKVIISENEKNIDGLVTRIAPEADPTTKRILVEAKPVGINQLLIGSVISISFTTTKPPSISGDLILPLSAISIGQNESHIFIVENNQAKQVPISIVNVQGEFAEIKTSLPADAQIIINGSKLVQDGEQITISQ